MQNKKKRKFDSFILFLYLTEAYSILLHSFLNQKIQKSLLGHNII
jgi:hypothetical protein